MKRFRFRFARAVLGSVITLLFLSLLVFDGIFWRLSFMFSLSFSPQVVNKEVTQRISVGGVSGHEINWNNATRASIGHRRPTDKTPDSLLLTLRARVATSVQSTRNINETASMRPIPSTARTIVVQLSGEMGNNLSKLAHGFGLALWLQREFGMDTSIVLRHQERPKWVKGQRALQECFPVTARYDFGAGNTAIFQERDKEQKEWLGSSLDNVNSLNESQVSETLQYFVGLNQSTVDNIHDSTIRLPFLHADLLVAYDHWTDKFYDDYRDIFRFDPSCCKVLPDPDESVFHFRAYLLELPRKALQKGYQELSPNQTARDLFGHLGAGDKVAITTRFAASLAQPYVDALERRGMQVRVITNQTDTEDFCFLLNAQKEMVGLARSTFFSWAGVLSNCSRVRAYSIDSPHRQKAVPNVFDHYNWTHAALKKYFLFELYTAD